MSKQWYVYKDGQQKGPYEQDALKKEIAEGRVSPSDLIWADGMTSWITVGQVPLLRPASAPPAYSPPPPGGPGPGFQPGQSYGAPGGQGPGGYAYQQAPKKGSGMLIGIIALLAVVIGVGGFFAVRALTGGESSEDEIFRASDNVTDSPPLAQVYEDPEQVARAYFDAVNKFDFDRAKLFASANLIPEIEDLQQEMQEDPDMSEMLLPVIKPIFENIRITDSSHTVNGNEAVVRLNFSAPDMDTMMWDVMIKLEEMDARGEIDLDNMADEEGFALITPIIAEGLQDAPTISFDVEAYLVRENNQWLMDVELFDEVMYQIGMF